MIDRGSKLFHGKLVISYAPTSRADSGSWRKFSIVPSFNFSMAHHSITGNGNKKPLSLGFNLRAEKRSFNSKSQSRIPEKFVQQCFEDLSGLRSRVCMSPRFQHLPAGMSGLFLRWLSVFLHRHQSTPILCMTDLYAQPQTDDPTCCGEHKYDRWVLKIIIVLFVPEKSGPRIQVG